MGKYKSEHHREKTSETELLYKKSDNTIFTHSRTCSGVSQLYSRSAVLQIKKNLQETSNYYTVGGKIRRDLSLETDICVLRRYYKNKRYKTSTYDSSAKSRYSTVIDTEVETIEEFPDTSACGDNDQTDLRSNPTLDIATMMIENLKDLLSQWFQRHLVDNKKNREKIDTVIDVLLSQLEQKSDGSSSYSTYIVHREDNNPHVKDKKIDTYSFDHSRKRRSCFKTESSKGGTYNESSSNSVPIPHMISTLSIPRSFHKKLMYNTNQIRHGNSLCKLKNTRRNDIIWSLDKPDRFQECSSIDFIDFTSEYKSKHFDVNANNKMTQIIFQPDYESDTNDTSITDPEETHVGNLNVDNVKDIPTLLKSLYIEDQNDMICTDRNYICEIHRHETFTMTDSNVEISKQSVNFNVSEDLYYQEDKYRRIRQSNQPTVTIGYVENSIEFPDVSKLKDTHLTKPRKSRKASTTCKIKNKTKLTNRRRARKFSGKYQGIQNKQFTFLYNKANNYSEGRDFLKHCRSVIEYFVNYEGNKNIKLDVQVNVLPIHEEDKKDASTGTSQLKLSVNDVKRGPTLMYNVEPAINTTSFKEKYPSSSSLDNTAEFITLLDGAVSQSKYIFGTIKTESDYNAVNVDRSTVTSELEIAKEISELRSIIKDLVLAAEKLVNENLIRESSKLHTGNSTHAETNVSQTSNNIFTTSKWEAAINLANLSKGVQCSNVSTKNPLLSGLKLSKEPKRKDMNEFANRLMKKSTSYRIIDSESILRVTDMTSNNKELNRESVLDATFNCSLPKSKSLFEMTTKRNKRKLMAFFCNGTCGPTAYDVDDCYDAESCAKKWRISTKRREDKVVDSSRPSYDCSHSCLEPPCQNMNCEYSTSAYSEVIDPEANKCRRKGMSFGEGCFYCFLLWIPVVIIMGLFYVYVLKDVIQPKPVKRNLLFLKLSDFGF